MKVKPQKKNIKFISITMTLFLKETNLSRKDAVNKVLQKELQFHLINKFKTARMMFTLIKWVRIKTLLPDLMT